MMKCSTVRARMLAASVLMVFASLATAQQTYPTKPIRFVVPYPPGGSTDPMARMSGQKLGEIWGQQVVVDNRPGGGSIIGTEFVAKSPADGYTILLASAAFLTGPSLFPHIPYDTIKDFDAVATIAKYGHILVVHPSVPANTLQALIALAKSRPGQLNYSSSGVGGGVHLVGELFNSLAGTRIQHVPYKGAGPAVTELIGGQVQLSFQAQIAVIGHINSGKLKALAITGDSRSSALREVPTFAEAGMPNFDLVGWFGIVAPAGTPKEIIDKMSKEMAVILAMPDIKDYLAKQGMEPFTSTPAQTSALIKADIGKYAKIIKAANIKME